MIISSNTSHYNPNFGTKKLKPLIKNLPDFPPPKTEVANIKTTENIFKKFLTAIGVLLGTSSINSTLNKTSNVSDYVNIYKYNFPPDSTITLPSGECINLNKYAEENAFTIDEGNIVEFVYIAPETNKKVWEKFIPDIIKKGKFLDVPLRSGRSYYFETVDTKQENILIFDQDEVKCIKEKNEIKNFVPIEAVEKGERGEIDLEKMPPNQKITCYEKSPIKLFPLPRGSIVIINGKKTKISEDSLAMKIYDNCQINSNDNLANLLTSGIKIWPEKDTYAKSTREVKFRHYKNRNYHSYRINNVHFEVIANVSGGPGGMGGYYWDNKEATADELDILYEKFLTYRTELKKGGSLTLNRDTDRIDVIIKP